MQWAIGPVVFAGSTFMAFRFAEVGQNIVPSPSVATQLGPSIIIRAVSTHIKHCVDQAGTTQPTASGLESSTPGQLGLLLCIERPVIDLAMAGHDCDHTSWRAGQQVIALAACLQETDADIGVLTQSRRHHGASRSATYNDVIKNHTVPGSCFCFGCTLPEPEKAAVNEMQDQG